LPDTDDGAAGVTESDRSIRTVRRSSAFAEGEIDDVVIEDPLVVPPARLEAARAI
jgi:hypothetical protein